MRKYISVKSVPVCLCVEEINNKGNGPCAQATCKEAKKGRKKNAFSCMYVYVYIFMCLSLSPKEGRFTHLRNDRAHPPLPLSVFCFRATMVVCLCVCLDSQTFQKSTVWGFFDFAFFNTKASSLRLLQHSFSRVDVCPRLVPLFSLPSSPHLPLSFC